MVRNPRDPHPLRAAAGLSYLGPLLALIALAAEARCDPQSTEVPAAILGEGALENDVSLPTSTAAASGFQRGDTAFALGVPALTDGEPGGATVDAFEAWRSALLESRPGDTVPGSTFLADPDATAARRTEAVEYALLRRLSALGPRHGTAWARRFGPIAQRELAAAGSDPRALSAVEHRNPATAAAVRAALVLADLGAESGEPSAGLQWLERAELHSRTAELDDPVLAAAIARRRAALARPPVATGQEPWRTASRLEPIVTIPLTAPAAPRSRSERGIRPGLTFLADGRCAVQTADRLLVVGADGRASAIELEALAAPLGWSWLSPFNDLDGEWPLSPASDGTAIVVVAGRSQASRGNALLCVEPGRGAERTRLRWAYVDRGFAGPGEGGQETRHEVAEVLGPGVWSFEPGPALDGSLVLVQARQWTSEADDRATVDERASRGYCLALDIATGRPRWKRLLATGADILALHADARLGARGTASPATPLAVVAGRVLAATELGAVALLETCDGRPCWTLETRRHAGPRSGRSVHAPIPAEAGGPQGAETLWTVAPADSDHVYCLRGSPLIGPGGLFVHPPLPRAGRLAGGDGRGLFFAVAAGDRPQLELCEPSSGRRTPFFDLAREESPGHGSLLSSERYFHATSRALALFDRGRDLELLDLEPLASGGEVRTGATLAAFGDRLVVVDSSAISIFRAQ